MFSASLSYQRLLIIFAAWWLLWFCLHTSVLYYTGWTWPLAATDSIVSNTLLAAACFATGNTLRYYTPGKNNWQNLLLWGIALAAGWLLAVNVTLSYLFSENQAYLAFLKQSLPVRYCVAFLMIGCVVLLTWLWRYINDQQENENRKAAAERISKEAELANLRQQLQPHFLFNSLNSISALIGSKPEEARHMLQQLSDFLRGTLKKDEQQQVTLEEELKQLLLYLEIEKVRFGHRLNTVIEQDEESKNKFIPALLLQPIVENAIKFGLYDTIGDVTIAIKATTSNGYLILTIENPFGPDTAQPRQGTGFGLSSVQRRLYLLYSRNDLLEININGRLFMTTIKIPQLN